jgi:Xaa-Pro aminopeptidase
MQAFNHRQETLARLLPPCRLLVAAGEPLGIPGGQDQQYPFIPHSDYFWLCGSRRPGGFLAWAPEEGWTDFRVPVTAAERIWEGASQLQGQFADPAELPEWLKRSNLPLVGLGAATAYPSDPELSSQVASQLLHLRRPKENWEVALVEQAIAATAQAFARLPEWIEAGASERSIGVRLEAEMFLAGCQKTGYGTIVGCGPNSAVLHWPPTAAVLQHGQVVLVDAGGEIDGYTADVTRVFPVGQWSSRHQQLHDILLEAQVLAVAECQIGVEWSDLHLRTAQRLAEGLRSLGILKVSAQEAVESEAIALFFPHGLGHMLGLGVRDASGLAPSRPAGKTYAGARIRMDLPLQENYLVTVEPGLYFIPALLQDPELRQRHAQRVAWDELEPWLSLGGMRIEDDVLVTTQGPRNLTSAIPK